MEVATVATEPKSLVKLTPEKVIFLDNSLCVCAFYQHPNGRNREPRITAHYVVEGQQVVVDGISRTLYEEIVTENARRITHVDGDYVAFDEHEGVYRSYREKGESHYERKYKTDGKLVCEEIDLHTYRTARDAIKKLEASLAVLVAA